MYERLKIRCGQIIRKTAEKNGIEVKEIGFDIDHVHLVLELGQNISIQKAVQLLKGNSSYRLFREFPWLRKKFFW